MSADLKYEDERCKRFNDSLDEEGDIEIAGIPFQRSKILYELATNTYKDSFDKFQDDEFQELKQMVFDEYPACVAYNFRLSEKGEGATDPIRKLLYLKDSWEAIVFVLYALVMGEVRHKKVDMKTVQVFVSLGTGGNPVYANFNTDKVLSDAIKPKIQNTKAIIQHCNNNGLGFKCEQIDETLLDDLLKLQDIRNDISHHAAPTREQAEAELIQVVPLFQEMLTKTRILEDAKIHRFDNLSSRLKCQYFYGYSLNNEYDPNVRVNDTQKAYIISLGQEQLFVLWDSECYSLSPFLHFDKDATGHESYVCFFKGRKDSKYWYEPVKVRTEKTFDHLQARFEAEKDEIFRLLVP